MKPGGAHLLDRRCPHRAPGATAGGALCSAWQALGCVPKHAIGLGRVLEPKWLRGQCPYVGSPTLVDVGPYRHAPYAEGRAEHRRVGVPSDACQHRERPCVGACGSTRLPRWHGINKKTTAVREFRPCPTTSSRRAPFPTRLSKELVGTARKACELATPISCFACAIDEAAGDSPWSRRHVCLRRLGRQATSRDPPGKTKLASRVHGHTTTHTLKMVWSGKWRCG